MIQHVILISNYGQIAENKNISKTLSSSALLLKTLRWKMKIVQKT